MLSFLSQFEMSGSENKNLWRHNYNSTQLLRYSACPCVFIAENFAIFIELMRYKQPQ